MCGICIQHVARVAIRACHVGWDWPYVLRTAYLDNTCWAQVWRKERCRRISPLAWPLTTSNSSPRIRGRTNLILLLLHTNLLHYAYVVLCTYNVNLVLSTLHSPSCRRGPNPPDVVPTFFLLSTFNSDRFSPYLILYRFSPYLILDRFSPCLT